MDSINLDFITINNHRYGVELLNPIEAIGWGNRALELFGPMLSAVVDAADLEKVTQVNLDSETISGMWGSFGPVVSAALSSCGKMRSDAATKMLTEAIQRCYTPKNEALSDTVVFNRHFREYPGDMFQLGIMALYRLVRDFFPKPPATAAAKSPATSGAVGAAAEQ